MRQRLAAFGGIGVAAVLGFTLLWGGGFAQPVSAMEKMAEQNPQGEVVQMHSDCANEGRFTGTGRAPPCWSRLSPSIGLRLVRYGRIGQSQSGEALARKRTNITPAGKPSIGIQHESKTFTRSPALNWNAFSGTFDDIEHLGQFTGKADRELGTRIINGKKAFGFQIDNKKMDSDARTGITELWLDAESNLPVLVRYESRWQAISTTVLTTDIQWNIDLDPKLFDTTPPAGYTEDPLTPSTLEEQTRRIAEGLKIYAEVTGGLYPPEQRIASRALEDVCDKLGLVKLPKPQAKEGNAGKAARAMAGLLQISHIRGYRPEFAYYGKSVGPKDKDKVLLRWKLDDGRYAVLFGDLRSETVTARRLHELEAK